MKVLVTGADGLLGANLVRTLLSDGYEVRAFVMRNSKSHTLDGLDVEIVRGDLLDGEASELDEVVRGCDAVMHCAGLTDWRAPDELMWRVNSEGTKRIVDASARVGVGRFIHTGSASSFGFGTMEAPGNECAGFPPEYRGLAYAESKAEASGYVLDVVTRGGLDAVVVAPTYMLGSFDERPSSGELICQFVRRPMRAISPGGRNFAHAADVARGMVNALERGRTGESYLLGGANVDYLEFFSMVARLVGKNPPRRVLPKAVVLGAGSAGSALQALTRKPVILNKTMARMACMGTYYDPGKAVSELSMPQTPVDQTIQDSVTCLREYGHI